MKKVTKGKMWVFAIGQLGWSILGGIITSWLVYFYQPDQETIALGHKLYVSQGAVIFGVITIVGLVTMIARIFDAFTDPLIASLSDRSKHKLGRRIPFLRYAAFPFAFVTVLIFLAPTGEVSLINNLWFALTLILFYLFMTLYCTPYNALIPELGKTQNDKINISTFISITFILGTALAYGAPFIWDIFIASGIERMTAIRITFGILAALALVFMLIPAFFIKERDYSECIPSKSKTFESLIKTFKNKSFKIFVLSDVFYFLALTLFQTGLPFFVVSLLGLEESMITVLFILMTFTSFLFYLPVNILAKRMGKKKLVVIGFSIFALVFFFASFLGKYGFSPSAQGILLSVTAAIPMAILGILPQAIVADIAQAESKTTGENREGMFFAARTFSFKLGQSVSLLLFTSLATIKPEIGLGYRIALLVAVFFTLAGALVLTRYQEKSTLKLLEDN